jgi:hypothetical protein
MLCDVVSLYHSRINQMASDLFGAYLYVAGDSRIRSGCNCPVRVRWVGGLGWELHDFVFVVLFK